jgi:hypothetical protein
VRVPIWPGITGELLLLDVEFVSDIACNARWSLVPRFLGRIFLAAIKFGTFLTVRKKYQWRFLPDLG